MNRRQFAKTLGLAGAALGVGSLALAPERAEAGQHPHILLIELLEFQVLAAMGDGTILRETVTFRAHTPDEGIGRFEWRSWLDCTLHDGRRCLYGFAFPHPPPTIYGWNIATLQLQYRAMRKAAKVLVESLPEGRGFGYCYDNDHASLPEPGQGMWRVREGEL